jgi:hypothetical protein
VNRCVALVSRVAMLLGWWFGGLVVVVGVVVDMGRVSLATGRRSESERER